MEQCCLWREVLNSGELPDDVKASLTLAYLVPFAIARREAERIEPFYITMDCIGKFKLISIIESGTIVTDEEAFDYINANNLLLDDSLVLDKRINDGRQKKYLSVLERLIALDDVPTLDRVGLVRKGLDWDSFPAFMESVKINHGVSFPNTGAYLERLVVQLQTDSIENDTVKVYIDRFVGYFIFIALQNLAENALIYFLSYHNKGEVYEHSFYTNNIKKEIRELYDKYRDQFEKHFIIVFH